MKVKYILGLLFLLSMYACTKIEKGFQSDAIRYKDNDIFAKRGLILAQSDRINADGSTPPYTFKMLNLRKEDGSPAPAEFSKEYEILVFKTGMNFDPETDVTREQLDKKRELVKRLPMYFNENSGQLTFNKASANLPLGRYVFDVEMTNATGVKVFPKLATINVVDPEIEDLFVITDNVANGFNDVTGVATPMKNPTITCTKISNQGARAILKMVDKNGKVFNPKAGEIIARGDRPIFENYAKFNPVIQTDTAMICDFEVAPFPLTKYVTPTTDWGFLMYYRIPSTFIKTIDGFPASPGFSVNPRWSWQLKLEGTYIIQVKFPDVVKK
ncbi:DUF5007 domain-containing protein [Pedobacter psychrodurus]|uniref:DUF5007 domain-containing protein n=1 Tax=Pedobacter psychrodurus TaxID=2530456 RepID=UPI00292FA9E3|nr:DUF5007 domain-containing protein [Pedobacter psychrodurus]